MTPDAAGARLARLAADGTLDLPQPGRGSTAERWRALFELARCEDVSVARLAEAHVDAVAILREAGQEPEPGALYGVWASVGPGGCDVAWDATRRHLSGVKPFCSGLGVVDRALVDVHDGPHRRLVDVAVHRSDSVAFGGSWETPALGATATGDVEFRSHAADRLVGPPGWYLDRVGFWHGACGPAACWAGGAAGLVDAVQPDADPHRRSRRGAMVGEIELLLAVLGHAGREIDERPENATGARRLALATRYAVHESCLRILDQFARAYGPRPLVAAAPSQRHADVVLYLRQFHADRDLVALAEADLDEQR